MTKATELAQLGGLVNVTGSGTATKVGIGTTVDITGGIAIKGVQVISAAGVWQGSTAGIQGAQGTTGTQGTTGIQGATGAQGTQGATGSQGTTGTQGATGTQGTQGASGPSTTINASDDTTDTSLFPVMVTAAGSNQTAQVAVTRNFAYNASTGTLLLGTQTAAGSASLQVLKSSGDAFLVRNGVTNYEGFLIQNSSGFTDILATSGGSTSRPAMRFFTNDTARMQIALNGQRSSVLASGSTLYLAYDCRAWVNFNGSSAAIRASGNVSSITKHGTGDYTVNFTNAMPDADYAFNANGYTSKTYNENDVNIVRSTTQIRMSARESTNAAYTDPAQISVVIVR